MKQPYDRMPTEVVPQISLPSIFLQMTIERLMTLHCFKLGKKLKYITHMLDYNTSYNLPFHQSPVGKI